ncbi:hypothetical protein Tco_0357432 [Tanacetum coccineum]
MAEIGCNWARIGPSKSSQSLSIAHKWAVTYLALATGAATPKKAYKFKKHASPSKKKTLVIVEDPEPAKKVKKPPATTNRSKGIDLLSEAALLEAAQVKKVLKRSRRGKIIHQAGGLGVPDVSKAYSSKNKYKFWGDSGDEANVQGDGEDVHDSDDGPQQADDERNDSENQETNDDEKESDDEFVHTPPNYVPTDDETNSESNDVDEEEYDRIDKELYGDVNVRLTDEEKGDADMTDAAHVQVKQTQE